MHFWCNLNLWFPFHSCSTSLTLKTRGTTVYNIVKTNIPWSTYYWHNKVSFFSTTNRYPAAQIYGCLLHCWNLNWECIGNTFLPLMIIPPMSLEDYQMDMSDTGSILYKYLLILTKSIAPYCGGYKHNCEFTVWTAIQIHPNNNPQFNK